MSSSPEQRRRGGGKRRSCSRKGMILDDSNNSSLLLLSSASIIGSNIDILPQILTRLPSKSLLVFKCVSKQWLSIITDPKFVHKHFIRNPKFPILGLLWGSELSSTYGCIFLNGNTDSHVPFQTLDFQIGKLVGEGIKIVQSCNGLLLCSDCKPRNYDRTYYIFNPFTKQYKVLPISQLRSLHFPYLRNVSLAFDPLRSPYYKVICFWRNHDLKYRIEIYNSETSSWRLSGLDSCNLPAEAILWTPSIFWNGSLYWCDREGVISYFDVDHESVGVVPLPTHAHTNRDIFSIAEYGGHFYLMEKNHGRFNIFELDYADCWKVKGHVNARLNPYARSPCGSTFLPVDRIIFITEEKQSTKVVLLTETGRVVTYDLKDMIIEKFDDLSARGQLNVPVQFHQYIESLACV